MTIDQLNEAGVEVGLYSDDKGFVLYATTPFRSLIFDTVGEMDAFAFGYLDGRLSVPPSPKEALPVIHKDEFKNALTSVIDTMWTGEVPKIG